MGGEKLMRIVFAAIIMLLTFTLAEAEMYQWIAEDGSVTFKDTPPPVSKKRKKVKVYNETDFVSAPSPEDVAEAKAKTAAAKAAADSREAKARAKAAEEARSKAAEEANAKAAEEAKAKAEARAKAATVVQTKGAEERARAREERRIQRIIDYENHRPWNDRTGGLN
jgi:flagellar biosynthesis/type III secretory pathway protein FliH